MGSPSRFRSHPAAVHGKTMMPQNGPSSNSAAGKRGRPGAPAGRCPGSGSNLDSGGAEAKLHASTSTTDSDSEPSHSLEREPCDETRAKRIAEDIVRLTLRNASSNAPSSAEATDNDASGKAAAQTSTAEVRAHEIAEGIHRLRTVVAKKNKSRPRPTNEPEAHLPVIEDGSDDMIGTRAPASGRGVWKDGKVTTDRVEMATTMYRKMMREQRRVPATVRRPTGELSVASELTLEWAPEANNAGRHHLPPPKRRSLQTPGSPPVPPPPPRRRSSVASTAGTGASPPPRRKPLPPPTTLPPPPLTPVVDKDRQRDLSNSCPAFRRDQGGEATGSGRPRPMPPPPPPRNATAARPQRSANNSLSRSCPENLAGDFARNDAAAKPELHNPRPPPRPLEPSPSLPTRCEVTSAPEKPRKADLLGEESETASSPNRKTARRDRSIKSDGTGPTADSTVASHRPFDKKGRCPRHPANVIAKKKLLGRGWTVLPDGCPECKGRDANEEARDEAKQCSNASRKSESAYSSYSDHHTKATNNTKSSIHTKSSMNTKSSVDTKASCQSYQRMRDLSQSAAAFLTNNPAPAAGSEPHRPRDASSRARGRWTETKGDEAPETKPSRAARPRKGRATAKLPSKQPRSSRKAAAESDNFLYQVQSRNHF